MLINLKYAEISIVNSVKGDYNLVILTELRREEMYNTNKILDFKKSRGNHRENLRPQADGDYCEKDYHKMIDELAYKGTEDYKFELPPKDQPNTSQEIQEHLRREYVIALLTTEMKMHKARQTRMNNDVQRYFNSSPLRNAFSRWMVYGYLVNKPYNITTLCDEMYADRKTVSLMIKDCEAKGWIQTIKSNGQLFCIASPILVDKMEDYVKWRRKLAQDTIGVAFSALKAFEDLMSIDTTSDSKYSTDL